MDPSVMNVIETTKNIIMLCLWIGGLGACFVLIFTAVLRWLAPQKTRAWRMNRLAALAAAILCFIGLSALWNSLGHMFGSTVDSGAGGGAASVHIVENFVSVFSLITKLLLFGIMMVSTVMLVLVIVLFLGHGLKAIFAAEIKESASLKEELKEICNRLACIMKSPVLIAVITWGILALFVTLPFLIGNSENGDLAKTWENGVKVIASLGSDSGKEEQPSKTEDNSIGTSEESDPGQAPSVQSDIPSEKQDPGGSNAGRTFYQAVIKYILLTVIVLGVSFAVFKLLYSIISRTFTVEKANDLINEYSGAIGVLSVGVAMLWTLQDNGDLLEDPSGLLVEFVKAFGIVMLIVALITLTLEVIRLLLDMREKLIRSEAKFLFVALVGEASLLLLSVLNSIYEAANHAIGNPNDSSLERVQDLIREKIVETMEKHLSYKKEYKRTFSGFGETIVKDGEEEEEEEY